MTHHNGTPIEVCTQMTDTEGAYLVELRPTWKKNLFWFLAVAIVLAAILS
jgi:hypothetical protein